MLFINIPMAAINTGLSNFLNSLNGASALVLGIIVGGMMAVDLVDQLTKLLISSVQEHWPQSVGLLVAVVMAAVIVWLKWCLFNCRTNGDDDCN